MQSTARTSLKLALTATLALGFLSHTHAQWGVTNTTASRIPNYYIYQYLATLPKIWVSNVAVENGGTFATVRFDSTERFTSTVVLSTVKLPLDYNSSNKTYSWPGSADDLVIKAESGIYTSKHVVTFKDLSPDQEYHFTILSLDKAVNAKQSLFQTKRRVLTVYSGGKILKTHDHKPGEAGGEYEYTSFAFYAINYELGLPWSSDPEAAWDAWKDVAIEYSEFLAYEDDTPWATRDNPIWDGLVPHHGATGHDPGGAQEPGYQFGAPTMKIENSDAPGFWLGLRAFGDKTGRRIAVGWVSLPHKTEIDTSGSALHDMEEYDTTWGAIVGDGTGYNSGTAGLEVSMGSLIKVRYE